MELALIALMLILVFKTTIISAINEQLPNISSNAESLIKYLGASAILSATVAALPSLFMIIYMRNEGFFVYELFTRESNAFGILAGNIFANFLVLSFGFFGAAVLFAAKADKLMLGLVALLNGLFITYFLLIAYVTSRWLLVGGMLTITLAIASYLYFWLSSGVSGKARFWYAPLVIAAFLTFTPILAPGPTAELTAGALSQMKVGGMMVKVSEPAQIFEPKNDHKVVKQWLVLRTPDALYLKPDRTSKSVTVLKAEGFTVSPSE
ncbi:hypothetical protein [Chromobacterium violaceum]